MENLKELYQQRKVFEKYNIPIPQELADEIHKAEAEIVGTLSETVIGYLSKEIEMPADCSVIIGVEFRDGKLVKTAAELNSSLDAKFENVVEVSDQEVEEDEPEENDDQHLPTRVGFSVKFADGKVVKCSTAKYTMIEALRYMGLERASNFQEDTFMGYPLIGKERRITDDGRRWQEMVDGWWVYINLNNSRKINCLKGVARMLNIDLEIIPDEVKVQEPEPKGKQNKSHCQYSLNGSSPMTKNRTVWAAVKLFLESRAADFAEIQEAFPAKLQGSYGVVRTVQDVNARCQRNATEHKRWFLDEGDILMSLDYIPFVVSKEWGDNFEDLKDHIKETLDFSIDEV